MTGALWPGNERFQQLKDALQDSLKDENSLSVQFRDMMHNATMHARVDDPDFFVKEAKAVRNFVDSRDISALELSVLSEPLPTRVMEPAVPCPTPAPRPTPAAPKQEVDADELLKEKHIILIKNRPPGGISSNWRLRPVGDDWLQKSFVGKGERLVRRQDLPSEAIVPTDAFFWKHYKGQDDAYLLFGKIENAYCSVGVISHAWLDPDHPDPNGKRRADVKLIGSCWVFWDFLSLFQRGRSEIEERSFKIALRSMHLIYGHEEWMVWQIRTVPTDAANNTPYCRRGWCNFETRVGAAGAHRFITIEDRHVFWHESTPVPMCPNKFKAQMEQDDVHFSCRCSDKNAVVELYERVFRQVLTQKTRLETQGWTDSHVRELLEVLPKLPRLKDVCIHNEAAGNVSADAQRELEAALAARGGELEIEANQALRFAYNLAWFMRLI
jgi:hypothetical protein